MCPPYALFSPQPPSPTPLCFPVVLLPPAPVLTLAPTAGIRLPEHFYKGGFPGHNQFGRLQWWHFLKTHLCTKPRAFTQVGSCISQCQLVAATNIPKMSLAKHHRYLWACSCYSTSWLRSTEHGAPEVSQDPSSFCLAALPSTRALGTEPVGLCRKVLSARSGHSQQCFYPHPIGQIVSDDD